MGSEIHWSGRLKCNNFPSHCSNSVKGDGITIRKVTSVHFQMKKFLFISLVYSECHLKNDGFVVFVNY